MTKHIEHLLSRYLDGESTQEELRQLRQILSRSEDLPAELLPYREMFALLDKKQTVPSAEALNRFAGDKLQRLKGKSMGKKLALLLAAACIAALAFVLRTSRGSEEDCAIAYVGGKKIADRQLAMQMGQEALQEIFSNENQEQQLHDIFNTQ